MFKFALLFCSAALLVREAGAQLDPYQRQLIQIGYNQPTEGRGPIAGYAFYYYNQPGFVRTNLTLRLALAPIYLDAELGVSGALGAQTDLGIGVAGGGFADGHSEIRAGHYYQEESFSGHGAEVNLSLYHRFNPARRIPLNGIVRAGLHYSQFERDDRTAAGFALPPDRPELNTRAGLRWGGQEPLLSPVLAMEISAWYEAQFRNQYGPYGYAGDREMRASSHLFWARALLAWTSTNSGQNFSASLTLGTSLAADRFSAYRLGAVLPLVSEFPLTLPGYYYQEISARQFALMAARWSMPLDAGRRWSVTGFGATAVVDYLPGMQQPGVWHSGVGGGVGYKSSDDVWQVILSYAYGLDAIRSDDRGAHSIGLLVQYDFGSWRQNRRADPIAHPERSRFLQRIFGR